MLLEPVAAGCSDSDPDDEDDKEGGCEGVVGGLVLCAMAPKKLPDLGAVGVVLGFNHGSAEGLGDARKPEGPRCRSSGVNRRPNGDAGCEVEDDV